MSRSLGDESLDVLFRSARTHNGWLQKPVGGDILRALHDLARWCPTSANSSPARFVFLRTKEAKERLRPALMPGNVEKTMQAPVTAIVAHDLAFYDKLPKLFPRSPRLEFDEACTVLRGRQGLRQHSRHGEAHTLRRSRTLYEKSHEEGSEPGQWRTAQRRCPPSTWLPSVVPLRLG